MSKKRKIIISVLVMIFIITTALLLNKENSFDAKILRHINSECDNNVNCIINISELTDFDWDTMYYFPTGAVLDNEDMVQKFGILQHGLADRQIIFMFSGKVVYSERVKTGIENMLNSEIVFDINRYKEGEYYKMYNKKEAIFRVEERSFQTSNNKNAVYYNLSNTAPLKEGEKVIELNGLETIH